jgi:hypothetical protein
MPGPDYSGLARRVALTFLLAGTGHLPARTPAQTEAGGVADIASQGYYLSGQSQPVTAISGLNVAFREYLPGASGRTS